MKPSSDFICPNPNCGYRGKPEREPFGSILACMLLLFCGIVPGVIYWALCIGTKLICPNCKMTLDKRYE